MESNGEQADFPTEQPTSGQDPRFPASDAHARRSSHPERSSPQGPQRTVGLSSLPAAVLPSRHRVTAAADFTAATRNGVRVRCGEFVYYRVPPQDRTPVTEAERVAAPPARVGLIVGKSVGGSVVRHRVSRRLRAQVSTRLNQLEPGSLTVIRALPEAGAASSTAVGQSLDKALRRLDRPPTPSAGHRP
jgi:ribonuclease P protein component